MSAVGFDVGNEKCVTAGVMHGAIEVILNDESRRETPTIVCFSDKQRFIGSAAAANASRFSESSITEVKWLIGRNYDAIEVQNIRKFLPFQIGKGTDEGVLIRLNHRGRTYEFTPVEIIAMIFKHLKENAEKSLQMAVTDCVIGIPSYFSDSQRRAYLCAAEIAGLNPRRLMHDCTATALGYGIYKSDFANGRKSIVAFVDIGQCGTQVSIVSFRGNGMKMLSHAFDSCLGGRDFDLLLLTQFADQVKKDYGCDIYSNPKALTKLRAACEKLKKDLSVNSEAHLNVEYLTEDKDLTRVMKREEFEKLSVELFKRVQICCKEAVTKAGISVQNIEKVELLGSGSRIPYISKMLAKLFGREPSRSLNSSECTARGCALHCAMLSSHTHFRDMVYVVQDSFPFSVGISLNHGPEVTPLFGLGEPFPDTKILPFGRNNFELLYDTSNTTPPVLGSSICKYRTDQSECSNGENVQQLKIVIVADIHCIFTLCIEARVSDEIYGGISGIVHKAKERERKFAECVRAVELANSKRSALESYVYKIPKQHLENEEIPKRLKEMEEWLNGDGRDQSAAVYSSKLRELQEMVNPIEIQQGKGPLQITKELTTGCASGTEASPASVGCAKGIEACKPPMGAADKQRNQSAVPAVSSKMQRCFPKSSRRSNQNGSQGKHDSKRHGTSSVGAGSNNEQVSKNVKEKSNDRKNDGGGEQGSGEKGTNKKCLLLRQFCCPCLHQKKAMKKDDNISGNKN